MLFTQHNWIVNRSAVAPRSLLRDCALGRLTLHDFSHVCSRRDDVDGLGRAVQFISCASAVRYRQAQRRVPAGRRLLRRRPPPRSIRPGRPLQAVRPRRRRSQCRPGLTRTAAWRRGSHGNARTCNGAGGPGSGPASSGRGLRRDHALAQWCHRAAAGPRRWSGRRRQVRLVGQVLFQVMYPGRHDRGSAPPTPPGAVGTLMTGPAHPGRRPEGARRPNTYAPA